MRNGKWKMLGNIQHKRLRGYAVSVTHKDLMAARCQRQSFYNEHPVVELCAYERAVNGERSVRFNSFTKDLEHAFCGLVLDVGDAWNCGRVNYFDLQRRRDGIGLLIAHRNYCIKGAAR